MSNDRKIKGSEEPHCVLREQDLDWLTRVAKAEAGLLILADADGRPIETETLRRCLALGVIEPHATEEGIGFRRTERAIVLLQEGPSTPLRDTATLRALLDRPGNPLALALAGGNTRLQRRMQQAGASALLAIVAGVAVVIVKSV